MSQLQLVPCPNGGKCGKRQHVPGSGTYKRCEAAARSNSGSSASYRSPVMRPPEPPEPDRYVSESDYYSSVNAMKESAAEDRYELDYQDQIDRGQDRGEDRFEKENYSGLY